MLPPNASIDAHIYFYQLQRLNQDLRNRTALVNLKRVMFHQENTWPHTARITSQKIEKFGLEKVPHSSYSFDLAPLDYHLICSLQNHLEETAFVTQNDVETDICEFSNESQKNFTVMDLISLLLDGRKSWIIRKCKWIVKSEINNKNGHDENVQYEW